MPDVPVPPASRSAPPVFDAPPAGNGPRTRWRPWRELLKRCFDIDIQCSQCGGPMRLKAFLTRPQSLRRLLETLSEPTEAPQRAPPRDPPYFQTRAVHRHGHHDEEPDAQTELFDEPA